MAAVNVKDVMNEIYQASLTLGLASGISMVLQKFTKVSLGSPQSLRPFMTLAVALGLGATALKYLEVQFKIPSEPFQ